MNPITLASRLIRSRKYVDQLELDYGNMKPSNWRTTAVGCVTPLCGLAWILLPQYHNQEIAILTCLVSLGLIKAADAKNIEK